MNCSVCNASVAPSSTVCPSCGSAVAAAPVPAGSTLMPGARLRDGSYAIGKVLGQGGFGITYKGVVASTRQLVAVKEFFPPGVSRQGTVVVPSAPETAGFEKARGGFSREAKTLARFEHPGVVRVYDIFEENNTAYMVMEFLEGESLQQWLARSSVLPEQAAVQIITQVGTALEQVHQAGVIHRDIKPDNIMIVGRDTPEMRAVLVDFGTARGFDANKTMRHTAMLTGGYAPLEQYTASARFGPYTDVYALGATLYQALTGEMPVGATDRLIGVELRPPAVINPYITRHVSDAVMWALQLRAPDRPQQIAPFVQALQGIAQPGAPVNAPRGGQMPPGNMAPGQVPPGQAPPPPPAGPGHPPNAGGPAPPPPPWYQPPQEDLGFYAQPTFKIESFLRSLVGIKPLAMQAPRAYHATQKKGYAGAKVGSAIGVLFGLYLAPIVLSWFGISLLRAEESYVVLIGFSLSMIIWGFLGYRCGYAIGHQFDRT